MKIVSQRNVLFLLVLLMVSITGCDNADSLKEVSQTLGISVKNGTEVSYSDTHGGFHGDGTKYIEISFSDETFSDLVKQSSKWKQLPLSSDLDILLYGTSDERGALGPYVTDSNGSALFPQIENGYYLFKDRFAGSKDSQESTEVLGRSAFNFTVAVYDMDTAMLYYCEFDT